MPQGERERRVLQEKKAVRRARAQARKCTTWRRYTLVMGASLLFDLAVMDDVRRAAEQANAAWLARREASRQQTS